MPTKIDKRLGSFVRQNAIGLIALMVALSGVAYAAAPKNSVTSKSIKNKGVKTIDIGDAAVTSLQVADESLGDPDISGLTAASIDFGVHGVFDLNAAGTATATANCPAGEIALGGGGENVVMLGDAGALEVSKQTGFNVLTGGDPTGWTVRYENNTAANAIAAYAICMPK